VWPEEGKDKQGKKVTVNRPYKGPLWTSRTTTVRKIRKRNTQGSMNYYF
jgi:hypothetical protein